MVSGKLSKLESGFLAGFLVALAVLVMAASTPSGFTPWSAFVGTNRIIIRTNAAGNLVQVDGQAIIDSSNALATQISAAQVWTNESGVIRLVSNSPPAKVALGAGTSGADLLVAKSTNSTSGNMLNFDYYVYGNEVDPYGMVFNFRDIGVTNTTVGTIGLDLKSSIDSYGIGAFWGGDEYGSPNASGDIAILGGAINGVGTGQRVGVEGFARSGNNDQAAVVGVAYPVNSGQTNRGVMGLVAKNGQTGTFAAGHFQICSLSGTEPLEVTSAISGFNDTGDDLLVLGTNNAGTAFPLVTISPSKTTNATPLDVGGLATLYGGLQVKNSATLDGGVTVGPSLASLFLGTNWQFVSDSLVPNGDLRLIDNWNLTTPLLIGTNGILTLSNGLSLPTGAAAGKLWTSVDSSGAGSWSNAPASSFTSLLIQTNGVDAGYATNINFPSNATVTISGQTATVGLTASGGGGLSGSPNFVNLSVQAAKLPSTNYPGTELGQQNWGLVFSKTNAEGSIVSLSGTWQFKMPKDYATNTMVVSIDSMLLSTNGPNTSNTIFRVSVVRVTPGDSTDVHTAVFSSTVSATNTWTQSTTGTNKIQNLLITMGTIGAMGSNDLCILKVDRDAANDTFGGDVSMVDLRIDYTR